MAKERIQIIKVVTKHFLADFWSGLQNIVGANLSQYEQMVQQGIDQIELELKEKKIKLKWYRYEMTQLTNGALAIMLYGEK
jgi:uncharacterized protein YbjQ (UPF0145 family)